MSARKRASGDRRLEAEINKDLRSRIVLLCVSSLLCYFVVEFFLFPRSLPYLPRRVEATIPEFLFGFTLKTKNGLIPHDYIAILGDSYAMGEGDERKDLERSWRNEGFGSGHRLFKFTGKDFFVLAYHGRGSLGSLLAVPMGLFTYLRKTVLYRLPEPQALLCYFYEGNDLNDNIHELAERFDGVYDAQKLTDQRYFKDFIGHTVLSDNSFAWHTAHFCWYDNLFFLKTVLKAIGYLLRDGMGVFMTQQPGEDSTGRGPGEVNRVLVQNREVAIPDFMQSPALELSDEEVDKAVYVFGQALNYIHRFFGRARVLVVYIPSPLSSYTIASQYVSIQTYHQRGTTYDAAFVRSRSDAIANKIRMETEKAGGVLIDSRDVIRRAAAERLIHGPLDWRHFNRDGYDALAAAIRPYLDE